LENIKGLNFDIYRRASEHNKYILLENVRSVIWLRALSVSGEDIPSPQNHILVKPTKRLLKTVNER
jgi:hypothetical protein